MGYLRQERFKQKDQRRTNPPTDAESFIFSTLRFLYPSSIMNYESVRVKHNKKTTYPDIVFQLPRSKAVLIEVTARQYGRYSDPKERQRNILSPWVRTNPDYAYLILYLQNFANSSLVHTAISYIGNLARGANSDQTQAAIDNIAERTPVPSSISWKQMHRELTGFELNTRQIQ